ncbi:diguanylate cyclase (GGDEF)-like protein [Sinobaca qinghaiensis]|uniref:Diguanylate cyclase (GGDEF)-like protein n=1 Tax=Sinobaca qinghaiensis TaxID=342944 RepID=A0A419V5C2_9BACL|nr:diguanylate cyclase [Sinobaca qinghaiensis]RKD75160.1 diguanylate cyclase (GGDEF)-like protein [Sinobaca qinghaiensis]
MGELSIYMSAVVFSGLLSLMLSLFAVFKIRSSPGGFYFILAALATALYSFSHVFRLSASSFENIRFWLNVEYLFIPFIPLFILLMCVRYVGLKIPSWLFQLLCALPVVTILMQQTSHLHTYFYSSVSFENNGPFPVLNLVPGPWYYMHAFFVFFCLLSSVLILMHQLQSVSPRYRVPTLLMAAGICIPILSGILHAYNLQPAGLDLAPVFLAVSFLFHGTALIMFPFFLVAPIARDRVFENMKEPVIVLNKQNMIIDYTRPMQKLLPVLNQSAIGQPVDKVLAGHQEFLKIIYQEKEEDFTWEIENGSYHFQPRFSLIYDKNNTDIGKIITLMDVTTRVEIEKELKELATIDSLTMLLNKAAFIEQANNANKALSRKGGYISIIMFDIDYFKQVNDTFGHEAGDRALRNVALTARDNLRASDIIGRYGGEEFIICLPDVPLKHAVRIAENLRQKIAASSITIGDQSITVTSSFGVASTYTSAGFHPPPLCPVAEQADKALYKAKSRGRNCVQSNLQLASSRRPEPEKKRNLF